MIDFKPLTIEDAAWAKPLLWASGERGAEYSFANALVWGSFYKLECAHVDKFMIARTAFDAPQYVYPRGKGDVKAMIERLMDDAAERGAPFAMRGLSAATKAELEQLFPGRFAYTSLRDTADYIYTVKDLSELGGRKYQPKRNLVSRFTKNYQWTYEDITAQNIAECEAMSREWCVANHCDENGSLEMETTVVSRMLSLYFDLHLKGGLLRVDGRVVAFTIGEPLNDDTFIVHIEKAFTDYQGAYQTINREFVQRHAQGFMYVNREDDAGDAGLRKAKESYHPVFLQEKFLVMSDER